jgi:microcystin-dependent protein
MSWNGSGTFNRLYSWVADAAAAIDINATRMDADTDNIAAVGFGNCLTRDGQGQPTADLPMAGFKHSNVANGSVSTDYAAYGQLTAVQAQVTALQEQAASWIAAAGTSDAITATYVPAVSALADGQVCYFRATAANLTTAPTFNPNALGADTITKNGGQALAVGDIRGDLCEVGVRYNAANTRWELLSPPNVPIGGAVPYFGGTVPSGFALPQGQNLSATTYPAANVVLGTAYGSPGGGNFAMPDGRGRVFAGLDEGGSARITIAGGNFDGTVLGNAGGAQNYQQTQTNLPNIDLTGFSLTAAAPTITTTVRSTFNVTDTGGSIELACAVVNTGTTTAIDTASTSAVTGTIPLGGSNTPLPLVQPTMMINWMMRIA